MKDLKKHKVRSCKEINAEAEATMEKIRQLQSETQQMERLIQQKEAQMKFYADLYEALDFVEFARKLYPADGGNVSYYDFIKDQMYFHQKDRVKDFPIRVSK